MIRVFLVVIVHLVSDCTHLTQCPKLLVRFSITEIAKANGLILYDYMVKCMKEWAKAEPDIDALRSWNFKH
ncbi:hypothetical protein FCV60_09190 [Vibrio sp. F13]|nr:hypothetical protein FCV60_09190 [Vibrio sp. F13]